jgi:hypothetical protein
MALVTLQTIFQDAFPADEALHPLPAHVRKAARAIMQCRTAAPTPGNLFARLERLSFRCLGASRALVAILSGQKCPMR